MPLLDHFSPPLSGIRHWTAAHSAWANAIARILNESVLPEEYFAEPLVKWSSGVEIDVATASQNGPNGQTRDTPTGPAGWVPPAPKLTTTVNLAAVDECEVQILRNLGGAQLRAAIEIVSPANKDRPAERHAFAVKCVDYLRQGASVIVIDIITQRRTQLHPELLRVAESVTGAEWQSPTNLSAIAYRTLPNGGRDRLQVWPATLTIGETLPTLPLWLGEDWSVPLNLEASYVAACRALRIQV